MMFEEDMKSKRILALHSAEAISRGLHRYGGRWKHLNSISQMLELIDKDGVYLDPRGEWTAKPEALVFDPYFRK